jgi:hypothetical protein
MRHLDREQTNYRHPLSSFLSDSSWRFIVLSTCLFLASSCALIDKLSAKNGPPNAPQASAAKETPGLDQDARSPAGSSQSCVATRDCKGAQYCVHGNINGYDWSHAEGGGCADTNAGGGCSTDSDCGPIDRCIFDSDAATQGMCAVACSDAGTCNVLELDSKTECLHLASKGDTIAVCSWLEPTT